MVKDEREKLNLWFFDAALVTVELQAKSGSCFHEVVKVSVMFLLHMAIGSNIICNADDTWALLENLVHLGPEDALGHHKSKRHSQEAVTTI